MRRRLWTDEEIRDILVAVGQAGNGFIGSYAEYDEAQAQSIASYCQGFRSALIAMARAFGIEPYQQEQDR